MRALVTGANGFLGLHVCDALLRAGHEPVGLVQPGTSPAELQKRAIPFFEGDVTEPGQFQPALRDVEVVLHLAAIARDWGDAALFERVNAGGTRKVLEASLEGGARRFVLMSSVAVHAYRDHDHATEDAPRDGGTFPYGETKIAAEDRVRQAHAEGRITGVVVRPGLVPFGPGDRAVLPPLARSLEQHVMPLVDGGRHRLSVSYAENLADGVVLAATHPAAAGETFLLADDTELTWRDFFAALAAELGVRTLPLSVPGFLVRPTAALLEEAALRLPGRPEPPLTRYRARLLTHELVFRSDKARRLLGWEPRVSFEEGIRRAVAWYRAEFG